MILAFAKMFLLIDKVEIVFPGLITIDLLIVEKFLRRLIVDGEILIVLIPI
jgi:hypothetical protein